MAKRGGQKLGGIGGGGNAVQQAQPRKFPRADQLTYVQSLGGSTGAQLMRDEQGNMYVVKTGASEGHVKEESLTDRIYESLGVDVVPHELVKDGTGIKKVSTYLDGSRSYRSIMNTGLEQGINAQLQKGFVTDALLANWDVVGLEFDNVLIDKSGKPIRVDNGGSLRYRAQGGLKGSAFGEYPMELFSLRSDAMNSKAARVYGSMSFGEVARQASEVASKKRKILSQVPDDLKGVLGGRLDRMQEVGQAYKALKKAGKSDYDIENYIKKVWAKKQPPIIGESDILNAYNSL